MGSLPDVAAITHARHRRDGLRILSDLTDAEWEVVEPLLPSPLPLGRTPDLPPRELLDAVFYILRSGIPWRYLLSCFPPHQTAYCWFAR